MKDLGYGDGYIYPHEDPDAVVAQEYFPEEIAGRRYYEPVERGFEREMIKRLDYWRRLRENKGEKEKIKEKDGKADSGNPE
jgi:putative ATPase